MKPEDKVTDVRLEDAFEQFNQLSQTLADSYGDLQIQVEHLSAELARARSERLKQLAEKELIANRLERLLDTLPAGVVVLDSDGCIIQANPVAHDMLGDNLPGQLWDQVARQALVSDGDELRLRDGRWISLSSRSLDAEPGRLVLITDITETHTLQATISRQQRLTSLGEMIASLAHQIRTPLATALLYLSNLTHPHAQSGDRVHYAEKARDRLHHLDRMVNDMLVFARGEVSDSECFDTAEFVDEFRRLLEPQLTACGASLTVDDNTSGEVLCGNRDALSSAFQNLVNNAMEARDQGLELAINVSSDETGMVVFSFSDNGDGIADAVKERVLEPFFTTRPNGTGLGLAVVNATVARFNGALDIQSRPGAGTSITIRLPRADTDTMLSSDMTDAGEQRLNFFKHIEYKKNRSSAIHQQKEISV